MLRLTVWLRYSAKTLDFIHAGDGLEEDITEMMKAVRFCEYGGPEVLRYGDYPRPEVGPQDVKVRVLATTISGYDLKFRAGRLAGARLPGRNALSLPMQLGLLLAQLKCESFDENLFPAIFAVMVARPSKMIAHLRPEKTGLARPSEQRLRIYQLERVS